MLSQSQYFQVPLKYVTQKLQKPGPKVTQNWNATICVSEQKYYEGSTAVVDLNLPLNLKWNAFLGVVYATVSNSTTFSPSLCSNQEGSILKSSCNFTYSVDMGPNIYIKIVAGNEGHIQYSAGVSFVVKGEQLPPVTETIMSQQQANEVRELLALPHTADDDTFESLLPIVRLDQPGNVTTGDVVYYTFTVCESKATGPDFLIEIVVIGAEPYDAFSTYACKAEPCGPDNGNVVASDTGDSSINVVAVSYSQISPGGDVYLAILGFGGTGANQFSLGAIIKPLP